MHQRKIIYLSVLSLVFIVYLFFRLGHYALWDDEANTALFAASVWQHGIPSAWLGHNLIAFRGGVELTHYVNLFMPPLTYYVVAPFVGLLGDSGFAARLPLALVGLLATGFIFTIFVRLRGWRFALVSCGGLVVNASYILYCRQSRYYALVFLFSALIAWGYLERDRRWSIPLLSSSALMLLFTHYIAFAATIAAIGIDYLAWGRRRVGFSRRALISLGLTQSLGLAAVLGILNPLGTSAAPVGDAPFFAGKLNLLWCTVRDMNTCEFGLMALIAITPILFMTGHASLAALRIVTAVCAYLVVSVFLSPQPVGHGQMEVADVRYMIVAIPAFTALATLLSEAIPKQAIRYASLTILFGTNLFHTATAPLWHCKGMHPRSTTVAFAKELWAARADPYTTTSQWLHSRAPTNSTVAVFPSHATYPLMWHAPEQVYAWQFEPEQQANFGELPITHFKMLGAPDFIVGIGGHQRDALGAVDVVTSATGAQYFRADFLPVHFPESYRPEFFWRSFDPPAVGPDFVDGISIYQKLH